MMELHYGILLAAIAYVKMEMESTTEFNRKKFQYNLEDSPRLFKEFKAKYNKSYTGEEKEHKWRVFYDNLKRMNAINQNFKSREWVAHITGLADQTYYDYLKLNNITKENTMVDPVRGAKRPVVNCTDHRSYLWERFATPEPTTTEEVLYYEEGEYPTLNRVGKKKRKNVTKID